jgi:lipopolysaccharide/colanic/teichoic acid biosynthesis glycosyltransferase
MLMTTSSVRVSRSASSGEVLYVQVGLLVVISVLVPACLFWLVLEQAPLTSVQVTNSIVGSTLAVALANYLLHRVTAFPGVSTYRYILPCGAIAFGLVVTTIIIGRFPYSSVFLTVSFLLSVLAATGLRYLLDRMRTLRFYVVPYGRMDFIDELPEVDWVVLNEPHLPSDSRNSIVADLRVEMPKHWERMLADAALRGQPVYHTKQLRESLTGRVSIEHLSENSFGSLSPNFAYAKLKRLSDIVAVLVALPLLALPMLMLAIAIRLESPGPALFRQPRMGHGGRVFNVLKFRSMYQRRGSDDAVAQRHHAITVDNDHRITRLGRFIRRTRIDELPQLINVLRGEMSLIGPRPEALALSRWYEDELPFYVYRHIVRPGITGWAQVNQGHVADLESVTAKLQYDFYYIKNYSAWIDVLIAIRTVGIMLTGFGSK